MKTNKSGVIVSAVITVVFIALGLLMFFLPGKVSPLKVTEEIQISSGQHTLYIDGKVKNESDNPIYVSYMYFTVTSSTGTYEEQFKAEITLQAGEEYEISLQDGSFYGTPRSLTEVSAVIDGTEYSIYGSANGYKVIAVVLFIFAAVFAIAFISALIGLGKQKKRNELIVAKLSQMDCHAQYFMGEYGGKGQAGKAAAKTAMSAIGGAISAILFGFGAYKIYGGNNLMEFVVTDDGLFTGNPNKNSFQIENMNFIAKTGFQNSTVTEKKNYVILQNNVSGEFFKLNTKNSEVTSAQLAERFNGFINSKTINEPVADPFAEVAAGDSKVADTEVKGDNAPEDPFAD